MFTQEQTKQLQAKLDGSHVRTRAQAGRQLSYLEGWYCIAEANRIFGFEMWHRETVEMRQLGEPREVDGKWRVAYMARVRVEVFAGERAIIREGTGYGSGIDRDLGSAHESAIKEAETDAMKRALMTFGNPFGLALYDKEQREVTDGNGHAEPAKPTEKPDVAAKWRKWWAEAKPLLEKCKTQDDIEKQWGHWTPVIKEFRDELPDGASKVVAIYHEMHKKLPAFNDSIPFA